MRKLSFKSFLQRTLRKLSAEGHTAPHQLAKEVPENPRLLQPLCLYVALAYDEQQQSNLFRRFPAVAQEFSRWPFLSLSGAELERALEAEQNPENGYKNLWSSYVALGFTW